MSGSSFNIEALEHKRPSVLQVMTHVLVALLPGVALYALLIDWRIVPNLFLAVSCALVFEATLLGLRKRPMLTALRDGSIVVAAMLLAISVPQSLPTWQLIFGLFVMCSLGKHVFGGLGHNPFNPAMVAYAVLIVSFPQEMTQWNTQMGFLDAAPVEWDAITRATVLERLDASLQAAAPNLAGSDQLVPQLSTTILQSSWTLISMAWLIGGLYLLWVKVIDWRIPTAMLGTVWCAYLVYSFISGLSVGSGTLMLFTGAIMFGAFFIATDPVSGAASHQGKLIYGFGIGLLCFFIREFSHYPEGVAFAVLLMNMCVPLIDHMCTRNTKTTKLGGGQPKP